MEKLLHIDSREWLAGGTIPVMLKNLPNGHYVRSLKLNVSLAGTKHADDTLDGDLYGKVFNLIRISKWVNISGLDLDRLVTYRHGKRHEKRTDIAATPETFAIEFNIVIPFADYRMAEPDDSAQTAELLKGFALELVCASATVYGGTSITITSGTIKVHANVVKTSSKRVPELRQIGYLDPGGQTVSLDAGAYTDCFLSNTDGSDFESGDVSNVDVQMEGESIVQNISPSQMVSHWSTEVGNDEDNGIVWPGPVLPLISTSRNANLITKAPYTDGQGGVIQLLGSETEPHLVYCRSLVKDEEMIAEVGRKAGLADPHQVDYEVRSKGGPLESEPGSKKHSKKAGLIMGKFVHPNVMTRRIAKRAFETQASERVASSLKRKSRRR